MLEETLHLSHSKLCPSTWSDFNNDGAVHHGNQRKWLINGLASSMRLCDSVDKCSCLSLVDGHKHILSDKVLRSGMPLNQHL